MAPDRRSEKNTETILRILDSGERQDLERFLRELGGWEVARLLQELPLERQTQLLLLLPPRQAALSLGEDGVN